MIDVKDNEVKENTNQSELAEDGVVEASAKVEAMPEEQVSAKPPVTEKPADSSESMENVMNLYEESFKRFAEGEVVTGRIISIDRDYVLVDVGYKSEGQIRIYSRRRPEHDPGRSI